MQRVLSELQIGGDGFVSVYLDDVIIFSSCFEDHVKHLKMVFDWVFDQTTGIWIL